ncbi:MAG: sugar nucleotide-binding protein, partial [Rickettsiales bacterium]|nr:sugar nucleotide-binding protein [Rickettsiales bacterium]
MNILVFGKNGQLGSNFYELLSDNKNYKAEFADREDVDFTQLNEVQNFLDKLNFKPDYIINCIAYTAVDKAEDEREICNAINVNAVKIIADFCKKIDAKLIHYSTDYVFDG